MARNVVFAKSDDPKLRGRPIQEDVLYYGSRTAQVEQACRRPDDSAADG